MPLNLGNSGGLLVDSLGRVRRVALGVVAAGVREGPEGDCLYKLGMMPVLANALFLSHSGEFVGAHCSLFKF